MGSHGRLLLLQLAFSCTGTAGFSSLVSIERVGLEQGNCLKSSLLLFLLKVQSGSRYVSPLFYWALKRYSIQKACICDVLYSIGSIIW